MMDDGKVTITIEIDAELLAQVTEVLKPYGLTPEEAAVQFFDTVPIQRHKDMRLNFSKYGKKNKNFWRGMVPMLSREGFCKALRMIRDQESIDEQFSKALNLVGNGHFVFGTENKYLLALRDVLKEAVNDQYDYIDWWLYEAADDFEIWEADCTMKYCLKEPEALYDFITGTLKPIPVSSGESTSQQE